MKKESLLYTIKSLSEDLKKVHHYWLDWEEYKQLPQNQFNLILKELVNIIKDTEQTEKEVVNITVPYLDKASTYLKRYFIHKPREIEDLDVSIFLLKEEQESLLKILRKIDTSEKFVRGKKFYFKKILFFDKFGLTEHDWQDVAKGIITAIMHFPMPMKPFLLGTDFVLIEKVKNIIAYDKLHKLVQVGMDEAINMAGHFDRLFVRGFLLKFWFEDFANKNKWLNESDSNDVDKFLGIMMPWICNGIKNKAVMEIIKFFPV
jgi:hypothetical protein